MYISIDWIKDFVDLSGVRAEDLRDQFTLRVAEVEECKETGAAFEKIYVAEITEINPHPNADTLYLATFNVGSLGTKTVVCGANNLKIGLKTPYIPVGETLPGGLKLKPKNIRGFLSQGMLCSERELGFSDEHDGIMELDPEATVGEDLKTHFGEVSDIVLDIDNKSLTHRPDLWGHFGHAREFAAVFQKELLNPYDKKWEDGLEKFVCQKTPSPLSVNVAPDSACLSYWGLSLEGIVVGPSPKWMKRRLEALGLRSINNIVDVSNYVMLELGIPLHIFDRDIIKGPTIFIDKLREEEADIVTLDGQKRKLRRDDTIIRDAEKILVLAGIMGGQGSSVSEKTRTIFIEVANWKAADIRRTSMRLGLRTDASERYEKSLDGHLCYRSLLRTAQLIRELCPQAQVVGRPEYDGISLQDEPVVISTSVEKITKILGRPIGEDSIRSILSSLGFSVHGQQGRLSVTVPTYRATKDIGEEVDLIEEIGRIFGYQHIEPRPPKIFVRPNELTPFQALKRKCKTFLSCYAKAFEVMTYPLIGASLMDKSLLPSGGGLILANALSGKHDRMRSSLIPSILETLALNAKTSAECRFFELGRVYKSDPKHFFSEHLHLALTLYKEQTSPFMDLVDICEKMLSFVQIKASLTHRNPKYKNTIVDEDWPGLHPFEFYNIKIMGKLDGVIFSIHPIVLRAFKIRGRASVMLIDLSSLEKKPLKNKIQYSPLPKFPLCHFDYCLEVDRFVQVESVLSCLKKIRLKELTANKVVSVYPGENGRKYLTMRSTFYDPTKTLSGDFLKEAETTVVQALEKSGYLLKKG